MNLRARVHVENQKKLIQAKLEARLAFLKEKGFSAEKIQKDATLRKIKALVRKADSRLASIAAQEKLNHERAQAKVEKLAAAKAAKEKPPEAEEIIPEKKKKGKKEKQEKTEPKKEKKEKKAEKKAEKDEKSEERVEENK